MTTPLLPILGTPGPVALGTNRTTAITGLSLSETGNVAGETFTVLLSDNTGLLSATGAGVSGSGTKAITIKGSLTQVNADLATLKDTDPGIGLDTTRIAATDSLGNRAVAATLAVTASGLPVITVPKAQQAAVGQPHAIAGVSLSEAQSSASETFTVTLSDTAGLLSASGTGVTGAGTKNLTITGSLSQVNADLATLSDTDSTAGTDTITINAHDSFGNAATVGTVAVGVSARPVITVPGTLILGAGQATKIAGVSLAEAYSVASETFTATVSDNRGLLSATGSGVSGSGTTRLTLTGSLAQVNAALATLSDTDSIPDSDSISISVVDSFGNSAATGNIALTANGLPVLSAPASKSIGVGHAASIVGVGINEAGDTAAGETFIASLIAGTGLLSATGTGVSGSGTTHLTITGTLTQVNAALATLSDTDGTAGSDTITITTTDSFGNVAPSKSIAVTVDGLPVIAAPSVWTTVAGQATPVKGVGLTESGSGASFTVTLVDQAGVLSATGTGITGSGTNSLTITGPLGQVNGDLSTLTALDPTQGSDTITITASDGFGNTAGSATIALTVSDQPVTVTSPSSPPPSAAIVYAPVIPQPTSPGNVVGLVLQNNQTTPLAARYVTFEEAFSTGQVPAGRQLVATINGQQVAVQMDVQTTNPDGSVKTALITLQQPVLAASSSTGVMLSLAPSASTQPNVNIANAVFNTSIQLTVLGASGNTPYSINVDQALQQALTSGAVSYWQRGPLATQVRVDVPVTGSLHVVMDLTAFADGQTSEDIAFDNDLAMQPSGGTISYDVTMTQNGQVALQQNNITQYQYQTWDQTLYSNGAPQVNIQHDVAALEGTGLIQNYDLSTGVDASLINSETADLTTDAAQFGILGPGNITQYMPTTGARADIGPAPAWDVAWLLTGNQAAATYALDMTNAAGSIPWHMYNPQSGQYLESTAYPTLWVDPRGGSSAGTTGLTQQADDFLSQSSPGNGWAVDPAHEPDTDYVAYLMTGNRYYLDQLNAEASYDVLDITPSARDDGAGIVATNQVQVRDEAWSLREVVEAASVNPNGSAEKTYFTQVMDNNFTYLLNEAKSSNEGQAFGWIQGNTGGTDMVAPWQQDYFATTVILAAQMGDQPAEQLLAWETNFLAGLFTSALQGFDPYTGATYQIWAMNSAGTPYQTWAQIESATQLNGGAEYVTPGSWAPLAYSAYQAEAEAVLAGDITVTGSTQAMQAYGWLVAHTTLTVAFQQGNPLWDIAPRLPDGSVLGFSEIQISHSLAGGSMTLIGGSGDNLLYAGLGNDTLQGGSGMNLLFANGGNDTLIGGPGADYIFAGAGNDTLIGGSGNDYEQAGSGSAEFVLSTGDLGNDLIAGFVIGTDFLHVLGAGAVPLGADAINALIAGATSDASGDAVLTIAPGHTATLQGIQVSQLSTALFN